MDIKLKNHIQNNEILNNDKLSHVFLINSPIVACIAKLIIDKYKFQKDRVFIIPIRNTSTTILDGIVIRTKISIICKKFYHKFFHRDLLGLNILKDLKKIKNKFILYTSWDSNTALEILISDQCFGHIYMEEGQLSYLKYREYKFSKNIRFIKEKILERRKYCEKLDSNQDLRKFNSFFNKNGLKYFCLSSEAFPLIKDEKKIILNNFEVIKKYYKPKLKGIKNIGIMCAPRRINLNNINHFLEKMTLLLPKNSVLKLHPGFYDKAGYESKILKILSNIGREDIIICDKDVVIEAEMLFEKKILFGPLTSLINYAKVFGSEFHLIDIYK